MPGDNKEAEGLDAAKLWEQVKENSRKLEGCKDHNFSIDLTPEKPMGKRWQCENCGGTIDAINKAWYERGREHERQKEVEGFGRE